MNAPITRKRCPYPLDRSLRQRAVRYTAGIALATVLSACSGPDETRTTASVPDITHLSLEVVSSQPHLVTGGSALIAVRHDGSSDRLPSLTLNSNSVALPAQAEIRNDEHGTTIRFLLEGLADGNNSLTADAGESSASLTLTNYPITGPVISGPHQQPYLCIDELTPRADGQARRFAIGNGEFLDSAARDDNCALPTRVDYVYRSQGQEGFQPLPADGQADDIMLTETSTGEEVPFIVRVETGTINRAIYQIAMLHDPASAAPSALTANAAWNQRLLYTFGGGCESGYFQGTSTGGVLRESVLARGYAVASSTLNVNAQGGCNDVLSAETAMMVKEHFTKYYGEPVHTIGSGASGGAMQQLLIAGAYPGILDGLLVGLTFSDAVTYFADSQECAGPWRNYVNNTANTLSDDTKAAVGGWPNWYLCDVSLGERPDRISPFDCTAEIPAELHYHPQNNPAGIRCSIYDGMRNIFGQYPHPDSSINRSVASSPHDNVGVQYGLEALNQGLIDKALFLDINENFGGWDIDYQRTTERTQGDPQAIRIAYETGRITNGAAGLSRVPIIDDRPYLDHEGNFHASVYSFTTRARLERDNDHANNYVIRRHPASLSLADENLALMDRWLDAINAANDEMPLLERIATSRPAELSDDCFTADGERIVEPAVFDTSRLFDNTEGRCNQLYPPHAGLRLVAGGPLTNDVMKCQLKPIDYEDYRVEFSVEEKARLEAAFPDGVCDWSRPGVGQSSNQTWLSFGPSPVNRYQADN
ncbi:MAG: DUF6351 family protein [Pseudohongiella sp.]|uniref:DUF6351 family protein n=1 Tax=Pseudohongiella sp. TaxID=1979412 RepID=UPI0034A05291